MTKGSGQPTKRCIYKVTIEGKDEEVIIKINQCRGCKKCPKCDKAFANFTKTNTCPEHKKNDKEVDACGKDCPLSFCNVSTLSELSHIFNPEQQLSTGH